MIHTDNEFQDILLDWRVSIFLFLFYITFLCFKGGYTEKSDCLCLFTALHLIGFTLLKTKAMQGGQSNVKDLYSSNNKFCKFWEGEETMIFFS